MKNYLKIGASIVFGFGILFVGLNTIGRYILPDLIGSNVVEDRQDTAVLGDSIISKRAPSFNLSNVVGKRVQTSELIGTPVIIVFWATWNTESTNQIKILDDYIANEKEQAKYVRIIAINSQEDSSISASFMRRGGYKVETLLDVFGDVSSAYNIKSLPTMYFVGKDGIVRDQYNGVLSEKMLVERVDNLLK